jgi:hypothetical protein
MGMYWIAGSVSDPDGVGTAGRDVYFFRDPLVYNRIVGPYSDDIVGPAGLSGRADQYMMNAYEDWRMTVAPGTYYCAIANDNPAHPEEGYGADPVEVTVTGIGYDIAPDLVLAKGAGPLAPAPRPSPYGPRFEQIKFGNRIYQAVLVAKGQQFIVSSQPRVSAKAVSEYGLNVSSIAMVLNEGASDAKTFRISSAHIVRAAGPSGAPTEVDFVYDFYQEDQSLPEGDQSMAFKASNAYGTASEVCSVTVAGGEPRLIGVPITYPSPVHLKTDREVNFQYTLSHDINVDLFLFDISGRVLKKISRNEREEGGSAGLNKVTWNLITDQGQKVASGICVFTLVNRTNGKLLGKGKFTALP